MDSGASVHCVKDRRRFETYKAERIEGNTAVDEGGKFTAEG